MNHMPIDRFDQTAPLRIAMVVPPWYELPPSGYGGVEQVCAALVDALAARGHALGVAVAHVADRAGAVARRFAGVDGC